MMADSPHRYRSRDPGSLDQYIGQDIRISTDGKTWRAYHVHEADDENGSLDVSDCGERRRKWISVRRPEGYTGPFLHIAIEVIQFPEREIC